MRKKKHIFSALCSLLCLGLLAPAPVLAEENSQTQQTESESDTEDITGYNDWVTTLDDTLIQVGDFKYSFDDDNNTAILIRCSKKVNVISGDFVIPETVTYNHTIYTIVEFVDQLFANNEDLTSVTIPKTIERFDIDGFAGCTNLQNIYIDEANSVYSSVDGVVFCKDRSELLYYPQGRTGSYSIPEGTKAIGDQAFMYSDLSSISMPDSVETLGISAFLGAGKLSSINLSKNILKLPSSCFAGTAFSSFEVPATINQMADNVFANCPNLESVKLPSKLNRMGGCCFSGCRKLTSVTLPSNLQTIPVSTFMNCTVLEQITLPKYLTSIEANAFQNCSSLRTISFPSKLESIGYSAFLYSGLTIVSLPAGISSIGGMAFAHCSSLQTVLLPKKLNHNTEDSSINFEWCVFDNSPHVRLYGSYETAPDWLDEYAGLYGQWDYENGKPVNDAVIVEPDPVEGWISDAGGWKYQLDNGSYVTNDWKKISGKWFYFGSNGFFVTGWKYIDDEWYYCAKRS